MEQIIKVNDVRIKCEIKNDNNPFKLSDIEIEYIQNDINYNDVTSGKLMIKRGFKAKSLCWEIINEKKEIAETIVSEINFENWKLSEEEEETFEKENGTKPIGDECYLSTNSVLENQINWALEVNLPKDDLEDLFLQFQRVLKLVNIDKLIKG